MLFVPPLSSPTSSRGFWSSRPLLEGNWDEVVPKCHFARRASPLFQSPIKKSWKEEEEEEEEGERWRRRKRRIRKKRREREKKNVSKLVSYFLFKCRARRRAREEVHWSGEGRRFLSPADPFVPGETLVESALHRCAIWQSRLGKWKRKAKRERDEDEEEEETKQKWALYNIKHAERCQRKDKRNWETSGRTRCISLKMNPSAAMTL